MSDRDEVAADLSTWRDPTREGEDGAERRRREGGRTLEGKLGVKWLLEKEIKKDLRDKHRVPGVQAAASEEASAAARRERRSQRISSWRAARCPNTAKNGRQHGTRGP